MSLKNRITGVVCGALFLGTMVTGAATVTAEEMKIGVINMQKVVASSDAGKKAQEIVTNKMKELQEKFKKDEAELIALQKEIEKKSSAWSDQMKQEKAIEFQKMRRNLGVKQEDANIELKKLREENIGPILKQLQQVVGQVGKDEGYTLILPNNVILYGNNKINLTDKITKALNEAMK